MLIYVQSALTPSIYRTLDVEPSDTFADVASKLANADGLTDPSIIQLFYVGVLLEPQFSLADKNIQQQSYIQTANSISELATKEAKQKAKLALAAAKRAADGNPRSSYDIRLLPTQYSGDDVIDNPGPLLQGRPWITDTNPAVPDDQAWVLMDGWYNIPGDPNSGSPGGSSQRLMAPAGTYNDRPYYVYGDEIVRWSGTEWQYINSGVNILSVSSDDVWYPWLATWTGGFTATQAASPL